MTRARRELRNAAFIVLAIASAGMGLKGFLYTSKFIDGGMTGVSMLINKTTGLSLSLCLILVNLPFITLAYTVLGILFAIRSAAAIAGLSIALAVVPFPEVTSDYVLTAVFGGMFLGTGIGFAIRGGAVLDGTEIAALLISKRNHLIRVGTVIFGFNVILFLTTIALLGVEPALYSILTYLSAAKTLDFVLYGVEEYTAITIISQKSADIRKSITGTLNRGVTVLKGYSGVREVAQDVLYCVVTRIEVGGVREIVQQNDPKAFVTIHPLSDAQGGTLKPRGHH